MMVTATFPFAGDSDLARCHGKPILAYLPRYGLGRSVHCYILY